MELNPQQSDVVEHNGGPLLVLAGAGSGKTRALVHRIANLITRRGTHPDRILAVTFTNKAAAEMAGRVGELVGGEASPPSWMATFHSACARILRREAPRLGLPRGFTIFDEDDQKKMLRAVAKSLDLPSDRASISSYQQFVEKARNEAMLPEAAHESGYGHHHDILAQVFSEYHRRMRRNGTLDFGDLIGAVVELLEKDDARREYYRERWQHVLVDEFQDTNPAQYRLLKLLVGDGGNLTVVGDDDQSIYAWRGASVDNLLDMEADYPNLRIVRLEQNYRSTQAILDVANEVISANHRRRSKKLWTDNSQGTKPTLFTGRDEREEATYVANTIERLIREETHRPGDVAVFYRTNAQSRVHEERLRYLGIPYRVLSGTSFYSREEIKDILAYLRIVVNHDDPIALMRIINRPRRGCGEKTLQRIRVQAEDRGIGIFEAMEMFAASRGSGVRKKALRALSELCNLIHELTMAAEEQPPSEMTLWMLTQLDFRSHLEATHPENATDRYDNVLELVNAMQEFEDEASVEGFAPTLGKFLERSALVQATDIDDDVDTVSLMTIHAAKGMEYPVAFVTGLEEGSLPLKRMGVEDVEDIEEERRLCYVAITRAEKRLFLTNCQSRRLYGNQQNRSPSRFLGSIPKEMLWSDPKSVQTMRARHTTPRETQTHFTLDAIPPDGLRPTRPSRDDSEAGSLVGRSALHKTFGEGLVTHAQQEGPRIKLTINFPKVGTKKVIRSFVEIL